jgi:hypothetical protein
LISAQKNVEFTNSNYNHIKKVYSIWLCTGAPKEKKNAITTYGMSENFIVGEAKEDVEHYDLMNVIMLYLDLKRKRVKQDTQYILKFLHILLSNKIKPDEKKKILTNDFKMDMSNNIDEELKDMCNLSEGLIEEGREERALKTILLMLKDGEPVEKIAKYTETTVEYVKKVLKQSQAKKVLKQDQSKETHLFD